MRRGTVGALLTREAIAGLTSNGIRELTLRSDALLRFCAYYAALAVSATLLEVHHANQERTPRSQLLSRLVANVERASRPRLT
jgi:hypothetical protein